MLNFLFQPISIEFIIVLIILLATSLIFYFLFGVIRGFLINAVLGLIIYVFLVAISVIKTINLLTISFAILGGPFGNGVLVILNSIGLI